jgi:hypothetical protein
MAIFSETTAVTVNYIEKVRGKYSVHDIHLNHPEIIIDAIKTS